MLRTRFHQNQHGFTLIEIMIVIAIMAAVLVGSSRMFNSATQKRTAIRKMAIATRDLRNVARLTNSTMRLVFQINDKEGHEYWVESAPGVASIMTEEQQKELADMTEMQREEQAPKKLFEMDKRVVRSPITLPRGLFFDNIEYGGREKMVTGGTAYVHFFPQGLSEEAAVHLTDRKTLNWTVTIHPLTGRAEIFERKVSLKELRQK